MMEIPTMTVEETTEKMRALGLKMSPDTLRRGIQHGTYPFGDWVPCEKAPKYTVYTVLFDQWVAERAVK